MNCEAVPHTTIEDIFAAVQAGTASYGVVPFENSSNGSVIFTLDLFADPHGRYPDIVVQGEIYLPVHHCLLGHAVTTNGQAHGKLIPPSSRDNADSPTISGQMTPTLAMPKLTPARVKPLHDLRHVKKLYSHPQAWGQCKNFLSSYVKHAERHDVSSTSRAAEIAAADTSGTSAAISSKVAADLNGLDVFAEGIEDSEGNSTRFLVLRRWQDTQAVKRSTAEDDADHWKEDHKTLVSFTVDHVEPGALADSLAVFKKYRLNLTSINSRPSGTAPWNYIFFIEFSGRKRADGEGGDVNKALLELIKVASSYRWLGSWENMLSQSQ